ncbi:S-type pyocin domain-containing protein [Pseudomonas chlororaphis]|uniref:S-type Pyocin n=1 Tax=Pseudomonas chlororaphis TaxID=587753 RepID=A0AAX3FSA8_9PSED|nr:S-type pyocin domain-containing protein [Pseudomonas chlororaphis]AZC37663.1 Uropathogenic specific protein [Pseudomonas chlororaphis subsp. piscium]AZC44211.1 Uropathogenic specific protein [Pseudomonas chlororaphis subsp. piscium]WDG69858.1 S-type pyocin domain-containing protein [Pseudomonas chlororaphis]WDH26315.1 S-type pyocin domain-containing protein [Pseudomonas chlororaphis]WDH68384.1 S-type pyocin domain-containing protein [Pseudomonas chlororaphis]
MRLLKNSEREARHAQSPHDAENQVRMALQRDRTSLVGLDELLREHYTVNSDQDILAAVRNGDWVLVTDNSTVTASSLVCPAPEPDPVYLQQDPWPDPIPRTDLVFAKSISSVPWGTTQAGTASEPAGNFGKTMLMASSATEVGLGRVAGELILRSFAWSLQMAGTAARTVGGPAGQVLLLAMTPTQLGDDSFYSEEQLRELRAATTRVRFQFRRDSQGVLQIHGIHTSAQSGQDSVPVIKAHWNADKNAMQAHLGTLTITWTPHNGPVITAPTTYPGVTDELARLMVHPIAEGGDSQLQGAPLDEFKVEDCIITFPSDSGIRSLYLVFAKPMVNPLEVGPANDLSSRSAKDGLDIDHIPSQKALEVFLNENVPGIPEAKIRKHLLKAPSIAIPRKVHQKYSETYGGRNNKAQQAKDAADLRTAVDSNLEAIKPFLLEEGFTEEQVEKARSDLHNLHQEQGWY